MASTPFVCVVDDQADFRFLLQQLFTRYFPAYSVRFFDDGQALLDELTELRPKPSLILLARHMPHLDGHQTVLALKGLMPIRKFPWHLMSADASEVEINGCYEAGVNSFLMKKMDFHSLKAMIGVVCHYWLETTPNNR